MTLGIEKLLADLRDLGYSNVERADAGGASFAVVSDFQIIGGSFDGRVIGLAIPAAADYPRGAPCAIHIKASPVLFAATVPNKVNIQPSPLGADWQYWSFRFILAHLYPTTDLMAKINDIFRKY